jgi:hypothetical protein
MPIPAEAMNWKLTHFAAELFGLRELRRPKPTLVNTHPRPFIGRYMFVSCTVIPQMRAQGAMTRAVANPSMAERIGVAPRHTWK